MPAFRAISQAAALRTGLAGAFLLIASCAFFADGLFFDRSTIPWDAATYSFPQLWFNAAALRHGLLPLWNPYLFDGYPQFADPQAQVFYPVSLAFALLTSFSAKAVYVQLVLHYFLAGVFMYLYAGLHTRNLPARLIAALIYMFNGFMVGQFQHLAMINTVAWLPLALFFLEKGWRSGRLLFAAPAGATIGVMLLAGHPQTMFYCFVVLLAFVGYRTAIRVNKEYSRGRALALGASALLIGLLLATIQLIPTAEFSGLANRSGPLPYSIAVGSSFDPSNLITTFIPDYFGGVRGPYRGVGGPSHNSVFFGAVALAILPFSLSRRRPDSFFFAVSALLALLVSMGDNAPVYHLLYHYVPGFDLFRMPAQFRFTFCFFIALLAAIGVDRWVAGKTNPARFRVGSWIAILAGLGALISLYPPKPTLGQNVVIGGIAFLLVFGLAGAVILLQMRRKIRAGPAAIALLLLAAGELVWNGRGAFTAGASARHEALEAPTPAVSQIQAVQRDTGWGDSDFIRVQGSDVRPRLARVYVENSVPLRELWRPFFPYSYLKLGPVGFDQAVIHGLFMVDGYSPILPRRYVLFNAKGRDKDFRRFLMLSNAKYVVSRSGDVTVLADTDTLPRAFLAAGTTNADGPNHALRLLMSPELGPRETAVVESPQDLSFIPACHADSGSVAITDYQPGRARMIVQSTCPAYVVFSETYYPGWKVRIDRGPWRDVMITDVMFMGTPVPAGASSVEFRFRPISFIVGATVTLITMMAVVLFSAAPALSRRLLRQMAEKVLRLSLRGLASAERMLGVQSDR